MVGLGVHSGYCRVSPCRMRGRSMHKRSCGATLPVSGKRLQADSSA